jgi:hypothetical protein
MAKYQIEDMIESFGVGDVQNNLRVSRREGLLGSLFGGSSSEERSSQGGSSGGASSLGLSGSGTTSDRTKGSSGAGSSMKGGAKGNDD